MQRAPHADLRELLLEAFTNDELATLLGDDDETAGVLRHLPSPVVSPAQFVGPAVDALKRRGLIVLISDLIDEPAETLKSIRLLRSHGHDVIVFQIRDATEVEFPFIGATVFRDLETGEELEVDPASVRESYLQNLTEETALFRKGLVEVGIDYVPLNTRQPYDEAFTAYLHRRAKLRG